MSYIFDALQRSETEGLATDSPEPSGATELLRRAERREASKWETATTLKSNDAAEGAKQSEPFQLQANAPDAPIQRGPLTGAHLSGESRDEMFREFRSLEVVVATQSRLVCFEDESLAAEAFRLLGVRLRHLRRDRQLKRVLVTSSIPNEGKSMVAANLASTLALTTQQRVLLLEGDIRRPSLFKIFGIGRNPGLCECLHEGRALAKCIYRLERPNLWILPAGSVQGNALELLQSGKLTDLMDQLAGLFDWIIVDSPPVLPLADTSVWARLADGILLVTRHGTTEKRHLQRCLEALEQKKLIGALLNCSRSTAQGKYYYRSSNDSAPRDAATR